MSQDVLSSGWESNTHGADRQPKSKVLCSTCVHGPPISRRLRNKIPWASAAIMCRGHGEGHLRCTQLTSPAPGWMQRACICSSLGLVKPEENHGAQECFSLQQWAPCCLLPVTSEPDYPRRFTQPFLIRMPSRQLAQPGRSCAHLLRFSAGHFLRH